MATETLTTISPTTNTPILTRTAISKDQLLLLPAKAQAAFRSFSRSTNLAQRQATVRRALELLEAKKDVLARELTEQMGRPIAYTSSEITTAIMRADYLTRASEAVL